MKVDHFLKMTIYPNFTTEFLKLVISGMTSNWNRNIVQMFLIIHLKEVTWLTAPLSVLWDWGHLWGMGCQPYLLHVAQHVLPTVEHPFALLWVELVDEVGGVVLVAVLVSETGSTGSGLGGGRLPRRHWEDVTAASVLIPCTTAHIFFSL